jgi:hypothetical protein
MDAMATRIHSANPEARAVDYVATTSGTAPREGVQQPEEGDRGSDQERFARLVVIGAPGFPRAGERLHRLY